MHINSTSFKKKSKPILVSIKLMASCWSKKKKLGTIYAQSQPNNLITFS